MQSASTQTDYTLLPLDHLKTVINNSLDYADQFLLFQVCINENEEEDIADNQQPKNEIKHEPDKTESQKSELPPHILDLSNEELEIKSSLNLSFTHDCIVKCKSIKITQSTVHFSFLNLIGSIFIDKSILKIQNCEIHDPLSNEGNSANDYLINCNNNSKFVAEDCKFYNSPNFGLCADDSCFIYLSSCIIQNISLFGIAVTCYSNFYAHQCQFLDIKNEHVFLDNDSNATCVECVFDKSNRRAFNVANKSSATIDKCEIKNCKEGALIANCCEKILVIDSHIHDLDYSAIYLDKTMGIIKKTTINNCNGNGVNITRHSKAIITQCLFHNTVYPAVAICDQSFSLVQRCEIKDSQMSGLIVRFASKAKMENCLISNSKTFGICISDSKGVGIIKTLINGSGETAINAYNHSNVFVKDSYLLGPSKQGFNVFCGAIVSSVNCVIMGMKDTTAWIHHAGSGCFLKTVVSYKPINSQDDILLTIDEICESFEENQADFSETSFIEYNDLQSESSALNPKIDRYLNANFAESDLISQNRIDQLVRIETIRPVVFQRDRGSKGEQLITRNAKSELPKYGLGHTHPTCKLCGKDSSDCFFFLCGHSVYCQNCWNSLGENKPHLCDLCHMNIDKIVTPIDCSASDNFQDDNSKDQTIHSQKCSICYESEVDTLIIPCGHTICHQCANHWYENNAECPFCRICSRAKRFVSYK